MQPSCLFCLETVEKNLIPNPIGCACRISAHSACFEQWFSQKQQMECPICHTVSIPNAVAVDNIRIVFIDTTREREMHERRFRGHEKAVAACCCLLMGWAIGITIIDLISRS